MGGFAPQTPQKREMKGKTISVRLGDTLYGRLEKLEKKTGLSKAEIIRFLVFIASDNLQLKKKELEGIRRELARIGNNINQVAKHLNTYKENADLTKHKEALEQINKLLMLLDEVL